MSGVPVRRTWHICGMLTCAAKLYYQLSDDIGYRFIWMVVFSKWVERWCLDAEKLDDGKIEIGMDLRVLLLHQGRCRLSLDAEGEFVEYCTPNERDDVSMQCDEILKG